MANYANLLATIAANIYTNGNQEVTAEKVKSAINAAVNSLGAGYQFMGVAHPSDTPSGYADLRAFWFAEEAGTYTNFGGLVLNDGEVAVIKYDGNGWSKEVTGLGLIPYQTTNINIVEGDNGKYITLSGSVGAYAPCSISEPIMLNKNERLVAHICSNEVMTAIARKISDNSYTVLVAGREDAWLTPYDFVYTAQSDNEPICLCYRNNLTPPSATKISWPVQEHVSRDESLLLDRIAEINNLQYASIEDFIKGSQIVESIKIYPVEIGASLSGLNVRLTYVGFNDSSDQQYSGKLVVQLQKENSDSTWEILFNSIKMPVWDKGGIVRIDKTINNIESVIEIKLSNKDIVSSPVVAVSANIIISSTHYALPKKELVESSAFNLIDYNNVDEGWMVESNGTFSQIGAPWCAVKWAKVQGLTKVVFGTSGNIGIGAGIIYNIAFYDSAKQFISNSRIYPNAVSVVDVPQDAVFMCFTDKTSDVYQHQVNAGETIKPYDVYVRPYYITRTDEDNFDWFFQSIGEQGGKTIHVGDAYDYNEIQDAINNIWDDASVNPYVLIIHPKNTPYQPFSMIRKSFSESYPWQNNVVKNITIIGLDKTKCIIQSNTGDYYNPPAELLTNGTIRNLTFKMTNLEHLASSTEGGYAAHVDARTKDDVGYNMLIQDCDFESATGPAVGIGTHMNGNLVFIGCKFISTADPTYNPIEGYTNIANWGVIFAHASTYENMTNQRLKFENCNGVHTLGSRSLSITGSGDLTVTLLRNIFYSIAQGAPAYNLSQAVLYDVLNYGNNIPT